jgi:hypothetical protein
MTNQQDDQWFIAGEFSSSSLVLLRCFHTEDTAHAFLHWPGAQSHDMCCTDVPGVVVVVLHAQRIALTSIVGEGRTRAWLGVGKQVRAAAIGFLCSCTEAKHYVKCCCGTAAMTFLDATQTCNSDGMHAALSAKCSD